MAAATRNITGTLYDESGAPWTGASIIFRLLTDYAITSDDLVLNKTYTIVTDVADGTFTATLAVPDSDAWQYQCILPDRTSFVFNLASGPPTTLHAIINDKNLNSTVSAPTLASYLQLSQVLDEDDMVSDSAAYPPSQQSVKAYIDNRGAGEINSLSNVTITIPADNEVLAYDNGSGEWINQTPDEAGLAEAAHNHSASDINSGTLSDDRIAQSNVTQHEGAITHDNLIGAGVNSHSQVDTHISSTSNPHSVTAAQVDAVPEDALILSKSDAYQLAPGDEAKIIECNGTFTITLPDGLDVGFQVVIVNIGTGTITLSAATTLNTKDAAVTLPNQYGAATVYHSGSNVWYAFGDLE